jgi:hypothetical protein
MSAKTFKTAARPKPPTSDQIVAFERTGAVKSATGEDVKEPPARVSLDIPAELHARFKAACARSRLKMTGELLAFIERRTTELEK